MPKIYQDEDSSESEGLELEDGTRYGKKTMGGGGNKGGRGKAVEAEVMDAQEAMGAWTPSQDLRGVEVVVMVVVLEEAVALVEDSWASEVETMTMMMTPTSTGRWGRKVNHRGQQWRIRNHASQAQLTPQLTETCHLSISLAERREPGWAIVYWIGLWCRRGRYTKQGCKGGW